MKDIKKTNAEQEQELEQGMLDLDAQWEDHLLSICAKGFGLTAQQYKEWSSLKTEEEMDAYLRQHSTKTWTD